jgi:hypothetical protein
MSLAFVPFHLVECVHRELVRQYDAEYNGFITIREVQEFLNYFKNQWLSSEEMIKDWNLFDRDLFRTNNNLEGFHLFMQRALGVHSPWRQFKDNMCNMYKDKQLAFDTWQTTPQPSGRMKTKKQKLKDSHLKSLKEDYESGAQSVERTIHYVHRLRMHEMSMELHKFKRGEEESSEANVEQTSTVVESNGEIIDPSRYTYAKRAYQFDCPGYMVTTVQMVRTKPPAAVAEEDVSTPTTTTLARGDFITYCKPCTQGQYSYHHAKVGSVCGSLVTVGDHGEALGRFTYLVKNKDLTNEFNVMAQESTEFLKECVPLMSFTLVQDSVAPRQPNFEAPLIVDLDDYSDKEEDYEDMRSVVVIDADDSEEPRNEHLLLAKRTKALTISEERTVSNALKEPHDNSLVRKGIMLFNQPITRLQFKCLNKNEQVNDEIINFYMNMLQEFDNSKGTCKRSHFFNTFFMTKLLEGGTYTFPNVQGWSKKFDISQLRRVFVPINIANWHWTMLVVNYPEKEIVYYDSLRLEGSQYLEAMLQYLTIQRPKVGRK